MANKQINHSYNGMIQDITKSEFSNKFYFEGKNIRIITTDTQSTGSITNEKGNSLILTIPIPVINYTTNVITYNSKTLPFTTTEISDLIDVQSLEQIIIGHCITRDYIILITTDNNGVDCIWKIDSDFDITLLYLRNLNLSTLYPVQILNNFENKSIDKIYWVDGKNQLRFLNINHSILNEDIEDLINLPSTVINMVGEYSLSQPYIYQVTSGGNHTAGMIQYTYNLYRLNSSQTKLSPFTELISLDNNDLGGEDVNEIVNSLPVVRIDNIDKNYTHIKVYSIKYTSINETPIISLVEDREIPNTGFIEVYDDGRNISRLSLEEFLYTGSDIIIPKHINSKFNRLFFANYKEVNFNLDLDIRAYSFKNDSTCFVYDNLFLNNLNEVDYETEREINDSFTNDPNDKFDSVNLDYDLYKFQYDGVTEGGEGLYLKYELTQNLDYNENAKYFKDNEIYRLGIEFYNKYGQTTLPKWISDFKSKSGNLSGNFNTFKFELKPEFFVWLNTTIFDDIDKPVGYRLLLAERTSLDKTIVTSGILSTMMINDKNKKDVSYSNSEDINYVINKAESLSKLPNFLIRNLNEDSLYGSTQPLRKAEHLETMNNASEDSNTEVCRAYYGDDDTSGRFYQYNIMQQIYSPEILFNRPVALNAGMNVIVKGVYKNTYNANWSKMYKPSDSTILNEGKGYNGITPSYSSTVKDIVGNGESPLGYGIISHPGGSDSNKVTHAQYYRAYGDVKISDDFTINNRIVTLENTIELSPTYTDTENRITQVFGNKCIKIVTNGLTLQTCGVNFTITPTSSFITENYNVKICSDDQGDNILSSLSSVNNTQTLSATKTSSSISEKTYTFYLYIDSVLGFECNVDLITYLGTSLPNRIEYFSNVNNYIVSNTPSLSFNFIENTNPIKYDIYGIPEITEKGQSYTLYNNDYNFRYSNTLTSIFTDGDSSWDDDGSYGRRIVSANSDNNRCLTLVLGENDPEFNPIDRPKIDSQFLLDNNFDGNDNILIVEIVKSRNDIYLGNIYGGLSYEDKQRTNYIQIGDYFKIDNTNTILNINSPGDTFVNFFKFARIVRKEEDIMQEGIIQYEEIVEYLTETTIDLKNRNDFSLNDWDVKFNPLDKDYHKYNTVYSQQSNLIRKRNIDYNIKKINNFDTNIISSKLKSSGELIDNWTDIQLNEILTLDGKFGAINALPDFNDEIYTIQDSGMAFISINPRVQTQASDGISIELGTGSVLYNYKYISSKLGTLNKWSVINGQKGIYFFDINNKSLNLFDGSIKVLSDDKLMHSYFNNNIILDDLKIDNPIINKGISAGYDLMNNDILMTFHQDNNSYTISYNEKSNQGQGSFISFYDYKPSHYIYFKDSLITTNPQNNQIYKHLNGNYNEFYGIKYPSHVILNINPEADNDCVFDNINFKSDVTLNNVDQVDRTLTHIQAYNDYQDSTLIPLIVGRNNNLRRKFRDWNALIPREGRNRIRAPYVKLKLQFDNQSNYKMILHNLNVFYTTA